MKIPHPLADLCNRIRTAPQPSFNAPLTVTIPIYPSECPEEKADRLRKWCAQNCVGRWRPLERWTKGAVRIEFEDHTDALLFRLSH